MTIDQVISKDVRDRMWDARITQVDLCKVLGISQSSLSRKLHGETIWRIEEIYALAKAFDVPVAELLPHLDSNQKPFD